MADTIFGANLYNFTRLVWTLYNNLKVLKFLCRFQKTNGIILIAATNRKDVLDP